MKRIARVMMCATLLSFGSAVVGTAAAPPAAALDTLEQVFSITNPASVGTNPVLFHFGVTSAGYVFVELYFQGEPMTVALQNDATKRIVASTVATQHRRQPGVSYRSLVYNILPSDIQSGYFWTVSVKTRFPVTGVTIRITSPKADMSILAKAAMKATGRAVPYAEAREIKSPPARPTTSSTVSQSASATGAGGGAAGSAAKVGAMGAGATAVPAAGGGVAGSLFGVLSAQVAVPKTAVRNVPYVSPIFQKPLNTPGRPLRGYVDLHTHLMNHLGFGGKLLYGGTDVGVMMPSGSIWKPACPNGWVMDSPGVCYSKCPDGYRGVGPSCFPFCPEGWTDAGITCTPPSYGRGVGYADPPSTYTRSSKGRNGYSWDPWAQRHKPEPPPDRNMSNGYDRCRYDFGENACEEGSPGIFYPKCETGWEGIGPICWERCRTGYGQAGLICSRAGIDIARERCANDNPQGCEQVGPVFFPRCRTGYQTFALTCTQDCPGNTTNIGLLCQKKLLARSGPQTMLLKTCNLMNTRAGNIGDALGTCASTHGGWDAMSNTCGDEWRNFVIGKFASMAKHTLTHDGPAREETPTFARWPKWNDVNHQQMWIDWVKRAHDGGLRVMVALAGNSITLAGAIAGNAPFDDRSAGDIQLDEMQEYAKRNSGFVEIAKSAADLRRIVGQDKLAIVPGVELDHLGGFGNNSPQPTADQVRAEIRRLYRKGARYVLPIHAANNSFGGTALYESMFLFANLFQTGSQIDAVCANEDEKIGKRVNTGGLDWVFAITHALGVQRFPNNCGTNIGFKNARGLQPLGKVAIDEMMTLGMIIDLDHSGQNTANDIVNYTGDKSPTNSDLLKKSGGAYPLVTGHSGPRTTAEGFPVVPLKDSSERSLSRAHYEQFALRGSIAGVGSDGAEAGDWMESARSVTKTGMPIAFGSDVNGMANLPRPPSANNTGTPKQRIEYLDDNGTRPAGSSATFKRAKSGSRTWDYNTEGVAHFGLFPDFLKDVEQRNGMDVVSNMYDGAEKFAQSWAQAESIAAKIGFGAGPAGSAATQVGAAPAPPGKGISPPQGGAPTRSAPLQGAPGILAPAPLQRQTPKW